MRLAFASIPFHCYRKICLKRCEMSPLNKMFHLRCEGRHEFFAGEGRKVRSFVHSQRRGKESARASHGKIVGWGAKRFGIDGHKRRMWRRKMRFVLRFAR